MTQPKAFTLALIAMFPLIITAASTASAASILPDIHTALTGEIYPLTLSGTAVATVEGDIELANAETKIPANSVSVLLSTNESSGLGAVTLTFLGFHENKNPVHACNTEGNATGVVVANGEFHFVYTRKAPLETGLLILFALPLELKCSLVEVEIKGPAMLRIVPVAEPNGDGTKIEAASKCSNEANGIAEVSSFFNDENKEVTGQLLSLSRSGSEFTKACELIKPTILLGIDATSKATMFSILPVGEA